MNAVGIGRSMVAILRPCGEIVSNPFVVRHLSDEIQSLIGFIQSLEPGFSEHMTRILKINRLKPLILLPFLLFYLKNVSSCVIIKPITHDEVNCYGYNKTIR